MSKGKASKTPAEVYLEPEVVWKIGAREYKQRPLSIRGLSRVLSTVATEINALVETPMFVSLASVDLANISTSQVASLMVAMLAAVPDVLPRFLASVLDTEDVDYIAEHAMPGQALKIFETLWDQNEPEVLIRGFFALGSRVKAALPQTPTTSE
jgi:hypothetical protein